MVALGVQMTTLQAVVGTPIMKYLTSMTRAQLYGNDTASTTDRLAGLLQEVESQPDAKKALRDAVTTAAYAIATSRVPPQRETLRVVVPSVADFAKSVVAIVADPGALPARESPAPNGSKPAFTAVEARLLVRGALDDAVMRAAYAATSVVSATDPAVLEHDLAGERAAMDARDGGAAAANEEDDSSSSSSSSDSSDKEDEEEKKPTLVGWD